MDTYTMCMYLFIYYTSCTAATLTNELDLCTADTMLPLSNGLPTPTSPALDNCMDATIIKHGPSSNSGIDRLDTSVIM